MALDNVKGLLWAWNSRRKERNENMDDTGGVKTTVPVGNGLITFLSYLEMYEVRITVTNIHPKKQQTENE